MLVLAVGLVLVAGAVLWFLWTMREDERSEELDGKLRHEGRPHVEEQGIDPNATATIARSGMLAGSASSMLRDNMQSTLAGRRSRRWPLIVLGSALLALGLWGDSSFFVVVGAVVLAGSVAWMIWTYVHNRSRLA